MVDIKALKRKKKIKILIASVKLCLANICFQKITKLCPAWMHKCKIKELQAEQCRAKALDSPEMAKPEKPTARTKNVMATPLV